MINGLLRTSLGAALVLVTLLTTMSLSYAEKINFDGSQKGIAYNLVRDKLKTEIAPLEKEIGRKLFIYIGRADLNGDGTPEIIASLPEEPVMCSEDVPCPYYIYAYTKRGLYEIGRINTFNIELAGTSTDGVRDLKSYENNKRREVTVYKWNGKNYEKAK